MLADARRPAWRPLLDRTDQERALAITPGSRVLQFAALSYDASVWEAFQALGNGATLVVAPAPPGNVPSRVCRLTGRCCVVAVDLPGRSLRSTALAPSAPF